MRRRALLAGLVASPALAQETGTGGWPTRTVELVVPYAAGGPTDRYAREFAPRLGERWGQQVVVSNKPGGATAIGTAAVAQAPPDGHTLLLASFGIVTNPIMLKNLPYDPKALAPLCRFALGGAVLYVHPSVPDIKALLPYLDDHWKEQVVSRAIDGLDLNSYPPNMPFCGRADWRPTQLQKCFLDVIAEEARTIGTGQD